MICSSAIVWVSVEVSLIVAIDPPLPLSKR
jgi:hypothetical protein